MDNICQPSSTLHRNRAEYLPERNRTHLIVASVFVAFDTGFYPPLLRSDPLSESCRIKLLAILSFQKTDC